MSRGRRGRRWSGGIMG